jgi:hypothetical protein
MTKQKNLPRAFSFYTGTVYTRKLGVMLTLLIDAYGC